MIEEGCWSQHLDIITLHHLLHFSTETLRTSLVAQTVKSLPAVQETQVPSLGLEDPLEMGMATHSTVFLARESHGRGTWWATVHEVTKSWT